MAFIIKMESGKSHEWHVQTNVLRVKKFVDEKLISLQADGDELDLVRERFKNLPITCGSICCWTGDFANFIFDNL